MISALSMLLVLLVAVGEPAGESPRFSGRAALEVPAAQRSADNRYALTASLQTRTEPRAEPTGPFTLRASLVSTGTGAVCGAPAQLLFRNGFE